MSSAPQPKPEPSRREPPREFSPLGIAAIFFAACNLLGPPIVVSVLDAPADDSAFLLPFIGVGIVLSQFGILPAWLVWGERVFWQRLTIHWALVTGLYLAWFLGLLIATGIDQDWPPPTTPLRALVVLFLCLPAVSLGIEAPMWVTRFFFGWRFCRPANAGGCARPLAIRDFLWGMAIISGGLAAIRGAAAVSYSPVNGEVWIDVAIAFAFAAVASLLVMLPIAWCILRLKDV